MRRIISVLCVLTICVLIAAAQQPQPNAPSAQAPPTIRVGTQLVLETVSVKDKNGSPIEGLTPKDFILTEDGVQQTISFAEFQRIQGSTITSASAEPSSDQD